MSEARERLFSYGTLQRPEVQRGTFGRLLESSPDAIVGWRVESITIDDPVFAEKNGAVQRIAVRTGDDADRIAGAVLLLTEAEIRAADAYEPEGYARVEARLASGGVAWVYARV
jgi:hypothetical protein